MEALYLHIANKLEGIRYGPKPGGNVIFDLAELKSLSLWRAVFAEFLAQVMFVILGCCSCIAIGGSDSSDAYLVKIGLAFGLAIMALIQMVGHVSGGHINPAVTVAMAVAVNITIVRAVLYIIAQVVGAAVGGMIVKGLTPSSFHDNLCVTSLGTDVTPAQGFGMELLLTFTLVTVIFGTTDSNRPGLGSPAVIIGLTVALGHFTGIKYTGASMNPTRSLGSAIASNSWADHWVYWVGPIAGGVLSAIVYKLILNPYRGVISMDEAIDKMKTDLPPSRFEDIRLKTVE